MTDERCRHLHALGFLYLASAHATDGDLDAREVQVIAERLAGWAGLDDDDAFSAAIEDSVALYRSCATPQARLAKIVELTERVESCFDTGDMERVLADLIEIAQADGRVDDSEVDFVTAVARTFGIEVGHANAEGGADESPSADGTSESSGASHGE